MRTCPTCGEQWAIATVCPSCGKVLEAAGVPSRTGRRLRGFLLAGSVLLLVVIGGAVLWGLADGGGSGQVVLPDASGTPPGPAGPEGERRPVPPQVVCDTDTGPVGCVQWMHDARREGLSHFGVLQTHRGVVLFNSGAMRLLDAATGRVVWQQDLGFGGEDVLRVVAPDPDGDTLVVAAQDHLVVHDLATGQSVRSFEFGGRPDLVLAAGDDPRSGGWRLLATAERSEGGSDRLHDELQVWDASGKRWSADPAALGMQTWGASFLSGPDVVVVTVTGGDPGPVGALDGSTGEFVWTETADVEVIHVGGPMVVVRKPGDQPETDRLVALDPRSGAVIWQRTIQARAMAAVPTATLVTITDDDRMTAVEATTGDVVWEIDVHPREQLTHWYLDGDPDTPVVILADEQISQLRGLDPATGDQVWVRDFTDTEYQGRGGLVRGDRIEISGRAPGAVIVLDAATGSRIVELRTNATIRFSPWHLSQGFMILLDDERAYLVSLQLPAIG